ncbi:MAG TPA: nucleotidyltransferase family protein [Burkholderiaceae bacterium]|nr:nucleotidyltransferase family protein [Burkholderiaceae bacterium]
MDIQKFAQLCKKIAQGSDVSALINNESRHNSKIAEMARDHRVLPLWSYAVTAREEMSARAIDTLVQTPVNYLMTNMRIKAQLLEIDQHLQGTNIRPILLKGAVQLFDGVYPSIGMRYMADIDILVNDEQFGLALHDLGYVQKNPSLRDKCDTDGKPLLKIGQRHLTPIMRANDNVAIEPHLLVVDPMYLHLLPSDFVNSAIPIPGCCQLLQPSRQNYLITALIHGVLQDRDRLDGALLLRNLIECELLYEHFSESEKETLAHHFFNCRSQSFFIAWRALSDWLFLGDHRAHLRSIGSFILIAEFKLRARGYRTVFLISIVNRIFAYINFRYWSSGGVIRDGQRFIQKDFWLRIIEKFSHALRG